MLHAPTNETKVETGKRWRSTAVASEREIASPSADLADIASTPRHGYASDSQRSYGNQALMRMRDSGASLTPVRPSQSGLLQRYASDQATPESVPPIVHEVLRSPGQPLDAETRAFMEPRFERDLGEVKVHADSKAADSAQAVNASAYTIGSHIVFGRNKYTPHTEKGKSLLAHELTHTIQQGFSKPAMPILEASHPSDGGEREAHFIANQVVSQQSIDGVFAKVSGGQILQKAEPAEEGGDASFDQTPASLGSGAIPVSAPSSSLATFTFKFIGDPVRKPAVFTSPSNGAFSITASAVMSATPKKNISYWIKPITSGWLNSNGDEKEYTTGMGEQTNSWSNLAGNNVISLEFSSGNTNPNNAITGQGKVYP